MVFKHYYKVVLFSRRLFSAPSQNQTKAFKYLPGPKGPLNLGTIFHYLPLIGTHKWDQMHKLGFDMFAKYGPIVKETLVPGFHIVWLFDPNDFAKLLKDNVPGTYPQRQSHAALEKYRKDRPHIYRSGGLLPTNGTEWWRIRSEFQKGLSSLDRVRKFFPETDRITKEFIADIQPTIDKSLVFDFLPELSRLNLELVCFLIFDQRMDSFTPTEKLPNSRTSKLIEAAEITNSLILPLEQGLQLWRIFPTALYKKLSQAQEYMESVAIDLVSKRLSAYSEKINPRIDSVPLLEEYLKNGKIDRKDIIGMAGDLLLGGIDTTTYTSSFLLYHLARNPTVQEKLYQETIKLLPHPDDDLSLSLFQSEYPRAVLKESFRLNPISVGVGRILNHDMIFNGYMVPKGVNVVTNSFVSCRSSRYFDEPEQFLPCRWIKKESNSRKINPFLVLPFGHGMRSCIARRMAEQNILVLMVRLIRKFEIGWAGSQYMDVKSTLINKPDQPVRITFKLRKEFA